MRNSGQRRIFAKKGRAHCWTVIIILLLALLAGTTSCLKWSDEDFRSQHPDKVLFERGISAAEDEQFDVARLTFETLVNTYPDSESANLAKSVLEDLKIPQCTESGESFRQCSEQHGMTLLGQ